MILKQPVASFFADRADLRIVPVRTVHNRQRVFQQSVKAGGTDFAHSIVARLRRRHQCVDLGKFRRRDLQVAERRDRGVEAVESFPRRAAFFLIDDLFSSVKIEFHHRGVGEQRREERDARQSRRYLCFQRGGIRYLAADRARYFLMRAENALFDARKRAVFGGDFSVERGQPKIAIDVASVLGPVERLPELGIPAHAD